MGRGGVRGGFFGGGGERGGYVHAGCADCSKVDGLERCGEREEEGAEEEVKKVGMHFDGWGNLCRGFLG